ncbi:MAG: hypothetical protein FWH41_10485, partial [Treponema sp.]|nr:hypothetical protein [Treponema sp.]
PSSPKPWIVAVLQKCTIGIFFWFCSKFARAPIKQLFSKQSFEKSYRFPLPSECRLTAIAEKYAPEQPFGELQQSMQGRTALTDKKKFI